MLRVVVLCAVLTGTLGQSTQVSQCTNNPGDLPMNTYIEGCTTPPCSLPQLQDYIAHITFKAPRRMRSMRTLATAYVSIGPITVPINYDLQENSVTCNFLTNSNCPVLEGEVLQYTLRTYIEPFFPVGVQVTIEFRVVDENTEAVFCLRVPVRIDRPVDGRNALTNNMLLMNSIDH